MKLIAPKAAGESNLEAPPAKPMMSSATFAERFSATPIQTIRDDTNPFSMMQRAEELQARLTGRGRGRMRDESDRED